MKVVTAKPLTMEEMMKLSETGDALIEIQYTYYDYDNGAFGLREVSKPNGKYNYLAYKIY